MEEEEEFDDFNSAELYELVPFLEAFPFSEYDIVLEKDKFDPAKMGVSPIILKEVSGLETPEMINFYFKDGDTQAMVTLYINDMFHLQSISNEVTSLNSVNVDLANAIESRNLQDKVKSIKGNLEFVERLGFNFVGSGIFATLLDDLLDLHAIDLPIRLRNSVRNLSAKINENRFSESELKVVISYYNFLLNHIRILLGVVIAAKIY
jgi:hypothetical protein